MKPKPKKHPKEASERALANPKTERNSTPGDQLGQDLSFMKNKTEEER